MIKSVIIDDESKAIDALVWELSNFKDEVEISATFTNPEKAISFLNNNKIDCLFLDIEMPKMNGFELLKKLNNTDYFVIITTAYNEYAITAIKNEALDYLLKPVDIDDLTETIKRLKNKIKKKAQKSDKQDFSNNKKIKLNVNGKVFLVIPKHLLFAKSDGNYTTLYFDNQDKIVVTKKLKEITELLPKKCFFRVHNSYTININKVKLFLKTENNVILENGEKIPVSRLRKTAFLEKL